MKQFKDLGIADKILRAVLGEGYEQPTSIQREVIPAMLAQRDIIGIAQTGTGKTASFVLPILDKLARENRVPQAKSCGVLIMSPTRELAQQITENIRLYSKFMKVSVVTVVGGTKLKPQIQALASGADIVVATPGRLLDHMKTGAIHLSDTSCVVLDEADQMLNLGFIPAIRTIMGKLPKRRQTVFMSATMPPVIRSLALNFQSNPVEISVAAVSRPVERIAQSVRYVPAASKREELVEILSSVEAPRAIVFTRTKHGANKLSKYLEESGLTSVAIHGNKSQSQRERALLSFRSGEASVLVATDIAARGIDIDDVSHVINYELPNVAEAYVHRIGRTARAGRSGTAISLCDPAENNLLLDIEKLIGTRLECEAGYEPPIVFPVTVSSDKVTDKIHRKRKSGKQSRRVVVKKQKNVLQSEKMGTRGPGKVGGAKSGTSSKRRKPRSTVTATRSSFKSGLSDKVAGTVAA